ncbi:hypothetical protein YB2330_001334 [Saitoella coloradoensis]
MRRLLHCMFRPHYTNVFPGAETMYPRQRIEIENPATEEVLCTVDAASPADVNSAVTAGMKAFESGIWANKDVNHRFDILIKLADMLKSRMSEFAKYESLQTGRPIREMNAQLARLPEWLTYHASLARTHTGRIPPFKGKMLNTLTYSPLGVVAQITPWNHPLLIAIKKIAPALAAGNSVVVKPSELAPVSVLLFAEMALEAGIPEGVLNVVCGLGAETGKALCEDTRIAKIDLTGGTETGRAVCAAAGKNLIPVTAELGGKTPVLVFPDIEVERAVKGALFASFIAAGQTCITGSRIIIHEDIYDQFAASFVAKASALQIGDPLDAKTQVGTVINRAAIDRCQRFVDQAISEGGKLLCGGSPAPVNGKGHFFQPTVLEVTPDMTLANEEVFGPVIALIRSPSPAHMLSTANSTPFALGAALWTSSLSLAHSVSQQLDTGLVWVNTHHNNDPSSPWGGWKDSGMGKENGVEAFEGYLKCRSTVVNWGEAGGVDWFEDNRARYG